LPKRQVKYHFFAKTSGVFGFFPPFFLKKSGGTQFEQRGIVNGFWGFDERHFPKILNLKQLKIPRL
jgi:hypothetical protein